MSATNCKAASQDADLGKLPVGESPLPPSQTENSPEIGGSTGKRGRQAKSAMSGILERRFKRRNNINSLPGLIREHSRLIALIRSGEIALDRGEVLSRAYGRHKEMVTALEQRTILEKIQQQLAVICADKGLAFEAVAMPQLAGPTDFRGTLETAQ